MLANLLCGVLRPRHLACIAVVALLGAGLAAQAIAGDELDRYLAQPDPQWHWDELRSGHFASVDYIQIILTSQTWRGIEWKHQLFLFRPKHLTTPVNQALLYIDGGRWNPKYESPDAELPRSARIFTRLAEAVHAPVAVLRQVPFQPLFDRREDALIAYTFDQYLRTGEPDWPLLLPMVKSAVRAMDVVQRLARERWDYSIERFTVAGASKRGWTSWLTAAADARVAAVAPMVIDMLNIPEQITLQRATFGQLSEQVQDYENIRLPERIESERGRELLSIVDPYRYRQRLTMPKLILLGTNDRYWPLDALRLYWGGLPEPKRVLYLPNTGHGLRDLDRLIDALSALHRFSARGEQLPQLSWSFASAEQKLELAVSSTRRPARARAWTASSTTRDFRDAHWSSHGCHRSRAGLTCTQTAPPGQYTALYAELVFRGRGEQTFSLSSAVCITNPDDATLPPCLDNAALPGAPSAP